MPSVFDAVHRLLHLIWEFLVCSFCVACFLIFIGSFFAVISAGWQYGSFMFYRFLPLLP